MNHHQRMQICSLVTLSMIALAMGRKILSEKPDFLNPCSITDHSFSSCFGKTVENIHTIWRNGVPGLKSVSSIDPMFVKRIGINQDLNNPISINLNLNNVTLTGLSDIKARESRFETKPLGVMVKMGLKKLAVNGGYDINGHIFTLPVGGKGTATISVESAVARVGILFKLAEDRGYTFTTVDDLRLDLQEVRGVYLNLDGADSSQENAILNSYGDAIFEILRPTLNEVLSKLFKDRWTKIFNYVPANYVFADLPGVKA